MTVFWWCVSFCCRLKGTIHMCTHTLSLLDLPPSLRMPPFQATTELSWSSRVTLQALTSRYFTDAGVYICQSQSPVHSPPSPCTMSTHWLCLHLCLIHKEARHWPEHKSTFFSLFSGFHNLSALTPQQWWYLLDRNQTGYVVPFRNLLLFL